MGDRPKKSWRELDAQRDRSGSGGIKRIYDRDKAGLSSERASKSYRAALDALFEKGEVGKIADKLSPPTPSTPLRASDNAVSSKGDPPDETRAQLRKKVLEALGRDEISRAVDRYVKQYGMPADFEFLEQAVEHNKSARVEEAFTTLTQLLDKGEKPRRARSLIGKLRFIEETGGDRALGATASQIRARL